MDRRRLQLLHRRSPRDEGTSYMIKGAGKIAEIKETIWWRMIRLGRQEVRPAERPRQAAQALAGAWAKQHNVKTKGLPT